MFQPIIRSATREDTLAMLNLIKELALYEKCPLAVTVNLEHFIESGFGSNPVYWALVAEFNKEIIGLALWYIRYSTWKGQQIFLEDLIVTERFRGKKVGKLLFDQLINEAKIRKINHIKWQVLDWNEPALNFYKKYAANIDSGWLNLELEI